MRAPRRFADGYVPAVRTNDALTVPQRLRLENVGANLEQYVRTILLDINGTLGASSKALVAEHFDALADAYATCLADVFCKPGAHNQPQLRSQFARAKMEAFLAIKQSGYTDENTHLLQNIYVDLSNRLQREILAQDVGLPSRRYH